MTDFGSLITAMITPFKQGAKEFIDYEATEKLIKHLSDNGSDAIIISGTTGESPTLSHEEEAELLEFVLEKRKTINPKLKVIFGAGSNSSKTTIKSCQLAQRLGADGVLVVTPYYNKPNQKGLYEHYALAAKATDLPIILYNVPSRTNVSLSAQTIFELKENFSNIHSLKEASNNLDLISEIRCKLSSDQFKIYSGDDSLTLPMMSVGADGVISVVSHLTGQQMKEMLNAFNSGDTQKAQKLHLEIFPLCAALFSEPNPTCIKAAMEILGIASGELREPLVALDEAQKADLKRIISLIVKNSLSV